ncbi:diguanylate cyclase [Clostridium sp.]|uniref:diguanylate cyclase domain-containing protein n=1 Tax=Clostridium sp. TaxID=1506 RepID=UPI002FCAB333
MGIDICKYVNMNISRKLPNFFDFIEADTSKIFGTKGAFIVFNIFNLATINEKYGVDIGDICIKITSESIDTVISGYDNIYGYRFGNNDFIITIPNYNPVEIDELAGKVEDEFYKNMKNIGFTLAQLNKFTLDYNEQIDCVEDFYELLFDNACVLGKSKEAERRITRHIIGTFTKNIRNTLASYKEANNLALKDDISGLSNHRAGNLFLSGLIEEYTQNQKAFTVLFIDGDNLKRYNKISYDKGNEMIRNMGQIITNSLRTEDKVFRWLSGDEFLVVLKDVDKERALNLAESVRKAVETETQECIYPTTISIGLANYPSDSISIEEIINKAEKANSYAKNNGRNKIVMWNSIIKEI